MRRTVNVNRLMNVHVAVKQIELIFAEEDRTWGERRGTPKGCGIANLPVFCPPELIE